MQLGRPKVANRWRDARLVASERDKAPPARTERGRSIPRRGAACNRSRRGGYVPSSYTRQGRASNPALPLAESGARCPNATPAVSVPEDAPLSLSYRDGPAGVSGGGTGPPALSGFRCQGDGCGASPRPSTPGPPGQLSRYRAGSTRFPCSNTWKCRWAPNASPVIPDSPSSCPARTGWLGYATSAWRCA